MRGGSSDGHTLFCIPGAGANVMSFLDLSLILNKTWTIYGLADPRGLDSSSPPHSTVQSAARVVLACGPHRERVSGPIHLLGHSFGGWVAFEMALRLHGAEIPLTSVTIVDSDIPGATDDRIAEFSNDEVFFAFVDVFEQHAERSLGIDRAQIDALTGSQKIECLHQRLVSYRIVPSSTTPTMLREPFRTFAASMRATYHPGRSYSSPVGLVIADDSRLDASANARRYAGMVDGWRFWAPRLLDLPATGNHVTALKMPNVEVLASYIDSLRRS